MPTVMTHAVVAAGIGRLMTRTPPRTRALTALLMLVAVAPDVDVIAWPLGMPYHPLWGHRGITHSLLAALGVAAALAGALHRRLGVRPAALGAVLFAAMASHGALDAFTNGGPGVAFFAPLDATRYFFPWRPVVVSPIGLAIFGRWGFATITSELLWIWLPLAAVLALTRLVSPRLGGGRGGPR
jgi:inner membrane protein